MSETLSDKGRALSTVPKAFEYFSPPFDLLGPGSQSNAWIPAFTHNFAAEKLLETQISTVNPIVSEKGEAEALKRAFKPYKASLFKRFWYWIGSLISGKPKILPKIYVDQIEHLDGIGDFPAAIRATPLVRDFSIEWLQKRDLRPKTLIAPHGPTGHTGLICLTVNLKKMAEAHRIDSFTRIIKISMLNRYPLYIRDRLPYLLDFIARHQDAFLSSYDTWLLCDESYAEGEEKANDTYTLSRTDDLSPPLSKTKMINAITKAIAVSSKPGAQPNLWNICSRIESNSPLKLGFVHARSRSIRYLPVPGRRLIDGESQRGEFIEASREVGRAMKENGCTKGLTMILLGAFPEDGHELVRREFSETVDILSSRYDAPFQAIVALGPIVFRPKVFDEAVGIKQNFLNSETPLKSFLPQGMAVPNPNPYQQLFAHYAKEMGFTSIDDLLRVR